MTAGPLLAMSGVEKSFPGAHALRGVDLRLEAGEVLALLGENGAGKSTLVRILGSAVRPDAGTIAIAAGIGLLTEDRKLQGLVLDHSVRANFGLPNLARFSRRGFVDAVREREACGRAIIMVSSDLPEVLGMADRILVMHDGRVTGVIDDVPGTAPARVMEPAHA